MCAAAHNRCSRPPRGLSNVVQRLICAASLFLIVSMLTCAEEEKVQSHRSKRTSAKRQPLLHLHNGPISALRPSGFSITQVFRAYPTVDGSVLQHSEKYSRSLISLCEFGLVFFLQDWLSVFVQISLDLSTHQHGNSRKNNSAAGERSAFAALGNVLTLIVMAPNSPSWDLRASSRTRRWCNWPVDQTCQTGCFLSCLEPGPVEHGKTLFEPL